jgi:MFS family permease
VTLSPQDTSRTIPLLKESRPWSAGTLRYTTGGLLLLFFWLLWGDFAWAIRDRTVPPIVQLLFKHFGASDTLSGFLFASLPAALALIICPFVAYHSDRYRSRWGRRIPFLVIPIPFIVVAATGIAFPIQIGKALHQLPGLSSLPPESLILIGLSACWTLFEFGCMIANSVFGALINDVVPQEVMGRFFGLFRVFSLLAGIFVNFWIMGKVETQYTWICLGMAAIYGTGFTLMCLKVKEGSYPPAPTSPRTGNAAAAFSGLRTYFRDSLGHSYYIWFFLATIFGTQAMVPYNLYSLFYAKSLGIDMDFYFKCIAGSYMVSLALAYPLGALVDRFHPLRISLVVLALYGLTMLAGFFYVHDQSSFCAILVLHTVLSGTYFTTSASLGQRLLPQSKFATIGSAGGILAGLVAIILPPFLGRLLDGSGHHYHYLFPAGLGLTAIGVGASLVLYRKFLQLGGPINYFPPQ